MRMFAAGACILSTLITIAPAEAGDRSTSAFDTASLAPADVTLFLHLENGAEVRERLANRPIFRSIIERMSGGALDTAWDALSRELGVPESTLFDTLFGRDLTFMMRAAREKDERSDWALVTTIESGKAAPIIARLERKQLGPRFEIPILELPAHHLLIAQRQDTLIIGPTHSTGLFNTVLARLTEQSPQVPALAQSEALRRASRAGRGEFAIYIAHGFPLGGHSLLVAGLNDDDQLRIRHLGSFESAPFQRSVTEKQWDAAPLDAFTSNDLLVMMEPTDVGGSAAEAFLEARLRAPLISREMRSNLGDAKILTVGELDGRQDGDLPNVLMPLFAIAIQMKEPEQAEAHLDAQVRRLAHEINRVGEGAFVVQVPPMKQFRSGEPRAMDITPATRHFGNGFPAMESVTLSWQVVDGPYGNFYVIASHPQQLRDTVRALQPAERPEPRVGAWANCGVLNGSRLGFHLRDWSEQAAIFTGDDPLAAEEFRESLQLLSEIVSGMDRCRWKLRRPCANEMVLDVTINLREPESAAGD